MVDENVVQYTAAGGVVVGGGRVLVLRRPGRGEVRLPKGHVEPGESVEAAALREAREESGYAGLVLGADLGVQIVEFEHAGRRVRRTERYFLMTLADEPPDLPPGGEEQFEPRWLTWDEALVALTFEAEREWVRRARLALFVPGPPLSEAQGVAGGEPAAGPALRSATGPALSEAEGEEAR